MVGSKSHKMKKVCSCGKHIFPQDLILTRGQSNRSGVLDACASIAGAGITLDIDVELLKVF